MVRGAAAAGELPRRERLWLLRALHDETVGGALLVAAAAIALFWANSPWHAVYETLVASPITVGPVTLSAEYWAADGLLAVFFFVVGVELRHEFSVGSLVGVRNALAPVAAALGGMVIAASLFLLIVEPDDRMAWGVPVSTDVAFALAVLAAAGRGLPVEVRVFLLTVAVVNDLGAIIIIAVFYGGTINLSYAPALLAALAVVVIAQRLRGRIARAALPLLLVSSAVVAWFACLRLGVHPTVAGALVGLALRPGDEEHPGPGERALGILRPLSAGVCVPLFAFTALGIAVDSTVLVSALQDRLLIGIVVGLAVGQPAGVLLGTWLATRAGGRISESLSWRDVAIVGRLAGIGLTVALLVAQVTFADDPDRLAVAKLSILSAIVVSSLSAAVAARLQVRRISPLRAD